MFKIKAILSLGEISINCNVSMEKKVSPYLLTALIQQVANTFRMRILVSVGNF